MDLKKQDSPILITDKSIPTKQCKLWKKTKGSFVRYGETPKAGNFYKEKVYLAQGFESL